MSPVALNSNPLLERDALPPFDRIAPEHVVPAVRETLARLNADLDVLERDAAGDWSLVEALNRMDYEILRTWGPAGHLLGVKNTPALREAYESVQEEVTNFYLRLGQSAAVYHALSTLESGPAFQKLTPPQQRAVQLRLRDARHSGVALEGAARERFNEIARELTRLSTEFSNNVLDATRATTFELKTQAEIAGLPESYRGLAAQAWNRAHPDAPAPATAENGPWLATLDLPGYLPVMQHGLNRELREKLYRAQISRASAGPADNTARIYRTLELRREQAQLLGFQSWAQVSLDSKMAPDVAEVRRLLEELRVASRAPAEAEMQELRDLARRRGFEGELEHWDIAFWAERLREERFQFTDEELRPYFPMPRVLDGLFDLAGRLFGVRIRPADGEAKLWHPDVRFFKVYDESGAELAAFYLDPYSRPEDKRGGAWMDVCIGRRRTERGVELPVAYLVCNGVPPVGDRPSLMNFREVETLFHEFGHGLQHMLTRVDDPDVAGISGVEWDAVELPSQFMENWCYHKPTLIGMTAHVDTGAPLPDELFEKISAARTFRAASDMLRQLRFALIDLELHHDWTPEQGETIFDVQRRIESATAILPSLPEDRFLCSFSHIFAGGYAAGYYSYKWAEVLSADAFSAFEEAGLDNEARIQTVGRRFRDTVLALGGSRPALEVFREFRGRGPDTRALLRHSGLAA